MTAEVLVICHYEDNVDTSSLSLLELGASRRDDADAGWCVEMDTTMEKSGGMAFEVLIKPATADSPRVVKNGTPTDRRISLELIDKKLKDAEDRRQVRTV